MEKPILKFSKISKGNIELKPVIILSLLSISTGLLAASSNIVAGIIFITIGLSIVLSYGTKKIIWAKSSLSIFQDRLVLRHRNNEKTFYFHDIDAIQIKLDGHETNNFASVFSSLGEINNEYDNGLNNWIKIKKADKSETLFNFHIGSKYRFKKIQMKLQIIKSKYFSELTLK